MHPSPVDAVKHTIRMEGRCQMGSNAGWLLHGDSSMKLEKLFPFRFPSRTLTENNADRK
jgi:hypothetical protein